MGETNSLDVIDRIEGEFRDIQEEFAKTIMQREDAHTLSNKLSALQAAQTFIRGAITKVMSLSKVTYPMRKTT